MDAGSVMRIGDLASSARMLDDMAADLAAPGGPVRLLRGGDHPLAMLVKRLERVTQPAPAEVAASRTQVEGTRELVRSSQAALGAGAIDATVDVLGSLRRSAASLRDAERAVAAIARTDRVDFAGTGIGDLAISGDVRRAMRDLDGYASILGRTELPLQGPMLQAFRAGRRLGAGEHHVVGREHLAGLGRAVLGPNHSGLYDMTLLAPLAESAPARVMKVAGYSRMRRLLVDPTLERAGAFTVQAGSKQVRPGVTRGDLGVAVAETLAARGERVVIMPEGRIGQVDTVMLPFDGASRAAIGSHSPLVPVANWGTNPTASASGAPRGVVTVIGAPIDTSGAAGIVSTHNVGVLNDRLHASMLDLLDEARGVHADRFGPPRGGRR